MFPRQTHSVFHRRSSSKRLPTAVFLSYVSKIQWLFHIILRHQRLLPYIGIAIVPRHFGLYCGNNCYKMMVGWPLPSSSFSARASVQDWDPLTFSFCTSKAAFHGAFQGVLSAVIPTGNVHWSIRTSWDTCLLHGGWWGGPLCCLHLTWLEIWRKTKCCQVMNCQKLV